MSTFEVTLPEALKPFLESQAMAEGLESPSAYLQEVIQKMKKRKELEAEILIGVEELERGLGIEVTPEFWERMHAEHRQRLGLP